MSRPTKRLISVEHPRGPSRLPADDPAVLALALKLTGRPSPAPDLGGVMSLNLHLEPLDAVLRIHEPLVTRNRLLALRRLRRRLFAVGLRVARPLQIGGQEVAHCRDRLAELEAFVPHATPPPDWESYQWLFGAMGELHRALRPVRSELPRPAISTYGPPGSLRRWMTVTTDAVAGDRGGREAARRVQDLVRELSTQWVPAKALPNQIIHGDLRLGNVGQTSDGRPAYLDFGFAARRPRIHDLAYSLFWMVLRPDGHGRAEDFPWEKLAELMTSYEEGVRSRLSPIEHRVLLPYLAAVPLYLAAISGYVPHPVRHLVELETSLDIADWALSNTFFT